MSADKILRGESLTLIVRVRDTGKTCTITLSRTDDDMFYASSSITEERTGPHATDRLAISAVVKMIMTAGFDSRPPVTSA